MNDKKTFACAALQGILAARNINHMSARNDMLMHNKIVTEAFDLAEAMEVEYDLRYSPKTQLP